MAWATKRTDVTCDAPSPCPITGTRTALPGWFLIRILLWLLVFAVFPLSVTAASLSFRIEVLGCTTYAALPPERPLPLAERVLVYLGVAERKESDPWLRDDIRIAWITTLYASRGNPQPHVDATYRVLGIHPDKVWPAILARREALLGRQYPTREAVSPMGIHATPGACDRGDADTDSILGCRSESGETGARIASGSLSPNESTTPQKSHDSTSVVKKPCASVGRDGKRRRSA